MGAVVMPLDAGLQAPEIRRLLLEAEASMLFCAPERYPELLVVGEGPGTFVDLRGWSLLDAQGDSRGGVYIKFKENEVWAMTPSSAATTRMAMSVTFAPAGPHGRERPVPRGINEGDELPST